jgi:hypothetical protein
MNLLGPSTGHPREWTCCPALPDGRELRHLVPRRRRGLRGVPPSRARRRFVRVDEVPMTEPEVEGRPSSLSLLRSRLLFPLHEAPPARVRTLAMRISDSGCLPKPADLPPRPVISPVEVPAPLRCPLERPSNGRRMAVLPVLGPTLSPPRHLGAERSYPSGRSTTTLRDSGTLPGELELRRRPRRGRGRRHALESAVLACWRSSTRCATPYVTCLTCA